jgi:DNA-binding GntR family transcriptional regulator
MEFPHSMKNIIDRNAPTPLYVQVKNILREQILNEEFGIGAQLPTEADLCEKHNISRITAKRALDDLAIAGVIRRIQGKGTFVSKKLLITDEVAGFSKSIRQYGLTPSSQILSIETIESDDNLRKTFVLPPDDTQGFTAIKRLLFVEDRPASVITSIFPDSLGKRIIEYKLENASLYDLIKRILGRSVIWSESILTPVIPAPDTIKLLRISPGSPHFHNRQISYVSGDIPVELGLGIFSADIFQWRSRMKLPGFEMRADNKEVDIFTAQG